mmetsp:Transcript_78596/g.151855  ORF Transcript_78596/g.151855 Transcript_78596/m.151855 type:complete len:269 (+) Transcript_78596:1007-1813(+)
MAPSLAVPLADTKTVDDSWSPLPIEDAASLQASSLNSTDATWAMTASHFSSKVSSLLFVTSHRSSAISILVLTAGSMCPSRNCLSSDAISALTMAKSSSILNVFSSANWLPAGKTCGLSSRLSKRLSTSFLSASTSLLAETTSKSRRRSSTSLRSDPSSLRKATTSRLYMRFSISRLNSSSWLSSSIASVFLVLASNSDSCGGPLFTSFLNVLNSLLNAASIAGSVHEHNSSIWFLSVSSCFKVESASFSLPANLFSMSLQLSISVAP